MPEYDHLYVRQGLEELEQVRASIRASISMTKMSRFPCQVEQVTKNVLLRILMY